MPAFIYSARRAAECMPEKVAAARALGELLELTCVHCGERLCAVKSTYERGMAMAASVGATPVVCCLECTDRHEGIARATQEAAVAASGGAGEALLVELAPGKGGDA
jgi:1-deoxy-D-xylulose 5-phosphate reductoisomerase